MNAEIVNMNTETETTQAVEPTEAGHSVETKLFGSHEEAKEYAATENGKLPPGAKRSAHGNVYVVRAPGLKEPLYAVAATSPRARDAAALHLGVIVELAEPKRKPKPTVADIFAATGGAMSDEEIKRIKDTLRAIEQERKGGRKAG